MALCAKPLHREAGDTFGKRYSCSLIARRGVNAKKPDLDFGIAAKGGEPIGGASHV